MSCEPLLTHVLTYTLTFVPAFIWLSGSLGAWVLGVAALIAVPHLVQDDGRLLERWIDVVKHSDDIERGGWLFTAIDQSLPRGCAVRRRARRRRLRGRAPGDAHPVRGSPRASAGVILRSHEQDD